LPPGIEQAEFAGQAAACKTLCPVVASVFRHLLRTELIEFIGIVYTRASIPLKPAVFDAFAKDSFAPLRRRGIVVSVDCLKKLLRIGRPGRNVGKLILVASVSFTFAGKAWPAEGTWILIETGKHSLSVMSGDRVLHAYSQISIGRNGVTTDKAVGDNKTPLGNYRISGLRGDTVFHRFFVIDYPSLADAERAHASGRIDSANLAAIRRAHERGYDPPASTPLGGNIGIHGIGEGDPRIHEDYNWTDGCVALTNEQIDDLAKWIRPGMMVVIR